MIIPMRCFTCGKPVSNLYDDFQRLTMKYNTKQQKLDDPITIVRVSSETLKEKTPQCKALDELGINRMCCRRMLLAQTDIYQDL